jgi:two-component system response regulator
MTTPNVEILLIEDNPHDVEMTLRALKQNKLANKVHMAKNGVEALDFIFARGAFAYRSSQSAPKLVLLDLKLPMVSGLEVLRAIKGDDRTRAIPVVVLTSSAEQKDMIESYHLGVNSYIIKPVDFDKFAIAIRHIGLYWLLINKPLL